MSSSDGSRKSHGSSQSNLPSRSSCHNADGHRKLWSRLRSILRHRLGLPLVCTFHGQDPGKLEYLGQKSHFYPNKKKAFSDVLLQFMETSPIIHNNGKKAEIQLTTNLAQTIDCHGEIPLQAKAERNPGKPDVPHGRVTMLLYNKDDDGSSRPLMLLEVGLTGVDWWKRFDHGFKYIKDMVSTGTEQTDQLPLLMAIMTIDNQRQNHRLVVKIGVFLCFWTNEYASTNADDIRLSLLWHSKTYNLIDGSEAFGQLLRGVCDFSLWITRIDDDEQDESQYESFGTDCGKVGGKVLRCYDNRFYKTERSPEIYLSPDCVQIVGEGAKIILSLPPAELSGNGQGVTMLPSDESSGNNNDSDDLWNGSSNRSLQVIVTTYRPGRHYATRPESFIPVICQLEKLHQKGFVHGDIRGFNTLFDEKNGQGYLIDFDYGGKTGTRKYPKGYHQFLCDGSRRHVEGPILPWHDWYALGRLIFGVHSLCWPKEGIWKYRRTQQLGLFRKIDYAWRSLSDDPTTEMISELKEFLKSTQKAGWTVVPEPTYRDKLEKIYGPGFWNT